MNSSLEKLSHQHALPQRQNSCCFCASYRSTKFNTRAEKVEEVSDTPKTAAGSHTQGVTVPKAKEQLHWDLSKLLQNLNCHVGRTTGTFPFWGWSEIFKFFNIFCIYLQKQILMCYCSRMAENKDFTKLNRRIIIQKGKHSWRLWLQPSQSSLWGWVLLEAYKHF